MSTLWSAHVTRIGGDAPDMIDAGVLILFGEPVPPALADVSVVHDSATSSGEQVAAGDVFVLGEQRFTVDRVGELANDNLTQLGHVVVYVNQPEQELLPGAILATGGPVTVPAEGAVASFERD